MILISRLHWQALIELLKGDLYSGLDSIVIYCTRRQQTEHVATVIRTCMYGVKRLEPSWNRAGTGLGRCLLGFSVGLTFVQCGGDFCSVWGDFRAGYYICRV